MPETGAPLMPGWAAQATFLGQIWLHHYWERANQKNMVNSLFLYEQFQE